MKTKTTTKIALKIQAITLLVLFCSCSMAVTTRIKDISRLEGVRDNQLIGYGLVMGLAGTGDGNGNQATLQGIANMLMNFGVQIDSAKLNASNVAAVMVTAKLKAFNVSGDMIDVDISSIGKAKSLRGGTLVMTPLKAANGHVYAVAQGALSVGGYSVSNKGSTVMKNHTTSGRIPNGAYVEKSTITNLQSNNELVWIIEDEDFNTIDSIRKAVALKYPELKVKAVNSSKFNLSIPDKYKENLVQLIAMVGELEVETDLVAKIVVNEKTGSVVMGGPIKIAPVAIAHENLNISVKNTDSVSQPNPLSEGQTALVKGSVVTVENDAQAQKAFKILQSNTSINDLVALLNELGVSGSDVITILQLMKEAGAIKARLEII